MIQRLHIIMPCCRPHNIAKLANAYLRDCEPHPWELRWHILLQGPQSDPKGFGKVNEALDFIPNGWVFTFADDTDQHPALYRRLAEVIAERPDAGCVLFAEDRGDRIFRPKEEDTAVGFICGGMAAYSREFIGDLRFDYDEPLHRSDGRFVERLYRKNPKRFVHIDEVLTKENSLEWPA